MKTCVIIGQNRPDKTLERLVNTYGRIVIFEPLPEAAAECREACQNIPGVTVFQAACGEAFYNAAFHVYNESGLSSSLGSMSADAIAVYGGSYDLSLKDTIDVQVVHVGFLLQMIGVHTIDFLLIDAQGMDFEILKTVEPWISESRVRLIQIEAEGKGFRHYNGLPDNSEESIVEWMSRFPQYAMSKLEGRLPEQPDLVFELKG
jgi:FkbM family methyltransferase